mmetsp:Transcript_22403/g.36023  ORF Transcript_22403/g.36023 Transcript_22403/m.36023 type:complete len:336 (+) Transcript_22403:3693-4700(+)
MRIKALVLFASVGDGVCVGKSFVLDLGQQLAALARGGGRANHDAPERFAVPIKFLDRGDDSRAAHLFGGAFRVGLDRKDTDLEEGFGQAGRHRARRSLGRGRCGWLNAGGCRRIEDRGSTGNRVERRCGNVQRRGNSIHLGGQLRRHSDLFLAQGRHVQFGRRARQHAQSLSGVRTDLNTRAGDIPFAPKQGANHEFVIAWVADDHPLRLFHVRMRDPDTAQRRAAIPKARFGGRKHIRGLDISLHRFDGRRWVRRALGVGVLGLERLHGHKLAALVAGSQEARCQEECCTAAQRGMIKCSAHGLRPCLLYASSGRFLAGRAVCDTFFISACTEF